MKKFRVYDLDNKKMSDVFDITQNPKYWMDKIVDGDIMQFTGWIDSKGNEIYEKDIVLVTEFGGPYEYTWLGGVKRYANCFVIASMKSENVMYHHSENQRLEVVGNIYDHRKLN